MFIDGLLNFYFIWSVVKQVLLVFLVLIFHSMFMKKNVFSNAMLLSIKRLQYFVLSLSCHGCLLKNKFLSFFRETCIYVSPFFSVTIQDIYLTVFSFISYSVYVFRKEAFKLFKYIQSNQINTWLLVHACEILDLRTKIGLFVLQIQWIIKLEFILELVVVILNIPLYSHSFC